MKKKKLFIIAVDFDGTLVEDEFPKIGEPKYLFYELKSLRKIVPEVRIILWTCREGNYLEEAVNWLVRNDFILDAVNKDIPETLAWRKGIKDGGVSSKIFANVYIDDRSTFFNHPHMDIFKLIDLFINFGGEDSVPSNS